MKKSIHAYKREYKIRSTGTRGLTYEVSFPKDFIRRKAEEAGLTVSEFLKRNKAVAYYDNFDGVFYRFEPETSEEVSVPEELSNEKGE